MKLATLLLGFLFATTGTAAAGDEVLQPPGGPVYAADALPPAPAPPAPPMHARGDLRPADDLRGDDLRGADDLRGDDLRGDHVRRGDLRRGDGMRGGGGPRRAERAERARQLRRALVATFDANGDGRLGPRERMRAARVLRRIEGRLAAPAPDARDRAARGALRRYDRDGDGHVGPGELPPAAARKLRRLDRDRDGWVEPGEYR